MTDLSKLETIAAEYHHKDLLGLNDLYHVAMRDEMIPPDGGRSALEVGCGSGSWTRILCQRYEYVDVVDGSQQLLDHVVTENADGSAALVTHHAIIEDFAPVPGQTWQHIYMTFILEHLTNPVSVLREIARWLRPGGKLIVAVPNADSLHRVLACRMGLIQRTDELSANDRRVGHQRVYTLSLLKNHLRQAGFEAVSERSIGLKPLTLKQMEHLPPEVGHALAASGDLVPEFAAYIGIQAEIR
jgi:SAM-dependent methyltransferase